MTNQTTTWQPVPYGCRKNPGCWDRGDGSLLFVEETAHHPGIERCRVRYYAAGRGEDAVYYRVASAPAERHPSMAAAGMAQHDYGRALIALAAGLAHAASLCRPPSAPRAEIVVRPPTSAVQLARVEEQIAAEMQRLGLAHPLPPQRECPERLRVLRGRRAQLVGAVRAAL